MAKIIKDGSDLCFIYLIILLVNVLGWGAFISYIGLFVSKEQFAMLLLVLVSSFVLMLLSMLTIALVGHVHVSVKFPNFYSREPSGYMYPSLKRFLNRIIDWLSKPKPTAKSN